ncbi:aspartate kinase [Lutibacter agarilyticus]|uniref:Aspartokinase n=1 Tax=Lutibacter agarilyticus TaxID=1109740 RepID=A0A238XDN8_9FLAO|nr:aspartate kinase [Lutibacter agarilyticus]SNR57067.1 aspartate kinase [Lutibacter agarilyticus]
MKVLKFGGTSVGSIDNIKSVKEIITDGDKKIVVLSAMSGTTNALVAISDQIKAGEIEAAVQSISDLSVKYDTVIDDLFETSALKQEVSNYIDQIFDYLKSLTSEKHSEHLYNKIVSQGELMSTYMFTKFLNQEGVNARLLPALDFMRIDKLNEPDDFYIKQNLQRIIDETLPAEIYITQGFICLDAYGNVANLQRGGSDYTATIIGGVIEADEVQIWTDIDGMHNNDPRFVENTHAISNLSFDEAAELAYFGAKILHPQTVMPAREANIPVRLKNTMDPPSYGTLISQDYEGEGIKAIAAKDGITAIKIKSARMLQAHGFLKKVFEIFEKYETPIDMITTSEIAVSLTIDNDASLAAIVEELEKFSKVEVDNQQSIICLVGHSVVKHHDTHRLFQVLQDIYVRMISYGGSDNNISLLVNTNDKISALQHLNKYIFEGVSI